MDHGWSGGARLLSRRGGQVERCRYIYTYTTYTCTRPSMLYIVYRYIYIYRWDSGSTRVCPVTAPAIRNYDRYNVPHNICSRRRDNRGIEQTRVRPVGVTSPAVVSSLAARAP